MKTTIPARLGFAAGVVVRESRRAWALIDWREVAAIVVQGLIILAVATFVAGEFTGRAVHRLNDRLAAFWSALLVPAAEAPQPEAITPALAPIATTAPAARPANAVWLLREAGLSQRAIALELGISRHRVKRELAAFA